MALLIEIPCRPCSSALLPASFEITNVPAGLLTYSIIRIPSHLCQDSGLRFSDDFFRAYSNGGCSGFTPDSLLIKYLWLQILEPEFSCKINNNIFITRNIY